MSETVEVPVWVFKQLLRALNRDCQTKNEADALRVARDIHDTLKDGAQ